MTKEIPEKLKAKKYIKLRSISISEDQSKWLYENEVSPQALLSNAIDELLKLPEYEWKHPFEKE